MSKNDTKKFDYLEAFKSNYKKTIQEADNFSKHFSNNSYEFRSRYLATLLEISQYYIDLQKKFISTYPRWYDDNLMTKNSQIITEMLIQAIRNMDSFYSEFVEYTSQNLRVASRIGMQILHTVELYHDMFDNVPNLQRDTFIKLIKEAKQHNDKYVKDSLEKRTTQNQKVKSKKETLAKSTA